MIKFYYHPSPNPAKVALLLEEAGIAYETVPVDTRKGEQHEASFLKVNPNAKTPAITDDGVRVFDSSAIMLYLGEKAGKFMGQASDRGELLSWLLFVASGVGPYGGQAVHFKHFAGKMSGQDEAYGNKRYQFEAKRHWSIIDAHLEGREWMVGDAYSIVDMSVWGWARAIPFMLGEDAMSDYPNLAKLMARINDRPAVGKVNALAKQFDFKEGRADPETVKALFPSVA